MDDLHGTRPYKPHDPLEGSMASHRTIPQSPGQVVRRLLLRRVDVLMLAICALGLLTAWLVYGTTGAYGAASSAGHSSSSAIVANAVPTAGASATTGPSMSPTAIEGPNPAAVPVNGQETLESLAADPEAAFPAASAPLRLNYPAAAMDVAVHPLAPTAGSQSIEPPATKEGYWLTPFGVPGGGSTNTTYIIGHSWLDQDAPFNHLSWAASPGHELTVTTASGVMTYKVDSVTTYSKSDLKDSPIWAAVPNRLVLVSCYSEDPWGRNVTVVASPVPVP
jgi:LPXTG-site transpeptidase (sortase) family protein